MFYCLDTNIIIDFFYNEKEVVERIQELEQQQVQITITPINLCELYRGAYLAPRPKQALERIASFLERVKILEFTEDAALFYGLKYAELKMKGKQTQEFDLLIASVTLAHNAILVTRNHKDFTNIKELKFVVW